MVNKKGVNGESHSPPFDVLGNFFPGERKGRFFFEEELNKTDIEE